MSRPASARLAPGDMPIAPADARAATTEDRPGRTCPLAYRYAPRDLAVAPAFAAETLFVVGGLYGNLEALDAVLELVAREPGARLAFNGDFHWFDLAPADFERVGSVALAHAAIRGNVETELALEDNGAGCGCAYPADVGDADVSRSNEILARLRETARRFPALRERQGTLPMHLVAQVGPARVGIVHGDAASLAGWGFATGALDNPHHARWIEAAFRDAQADIFASSHTCLPVLRAFPVDRSVRAVINNGAAGMPNFAGTGHGVVTRISVRPAPGGSLYGLRVAGVHVEALALDFDTARWLERFEAAWPAGSPAHDSYFRRITQGPRYTPDQAAP